MPAASFFATCAPGLEPLLEAELRALRLGRVERAVGGVRFTGSLSDAWRANLELATAVRVLLELARFPAADADQLYAGVREVDWRRFVRPEGTLRVHARASRSALEHTLFVAQRTKDAICDQLRELTGARPSVERRGADLVVHAHLVDDRCRLLVDTSGESLHKRGWRRAQGRAPLAETLAAAVLRLSGWDRRAPLLDPFCGSGTLLVEAALWASGTPPGALRERFGFELWQGHDAAAFDALRRAAREPRPLPRKLTLWGGDRDPERVAEARANLAAAGFGEAVEVAVADARELAPRPGWNAWIVTNPPYGERVGDERELRGLYAAFGRVLRERCAGYRLALLSGNPQLAAELGVQLRDRVPLKNGALDCELLLADLGA